MYLFAIFYLHNGAQQGIHDTPTKFFFP